MGVDEGVIGEGVVTVTNSTLYIREGDTIRLRNSLEGWKVLREAGGEAVPSPLGGVSIYLPSVVAENVVGQVRVFQQVSPKFWVMARKAAPNVAIPKEALRALGK